MTERKPSYNVKSVHGLGSDPASMLHRVFNRLEEVAKQVDSSLADRIDRMERLGCSRVILSGSGPTLFGLLPSGEHTEQEWLSRFPDSRHVSIVRPAATGFRFLRHSALESE